MNLFLSFLVAWGMRAALEDGPPPGPPGGPPQAEGRNQEGPRERGRARQARRDDAQSREAPRRPADGPPPGAQGMGAGPRRGAQQNAGNPPPRGDAPVPPNGPGIGGPGMPPPGGPGGLGGGGMGGFGGAGGMNGGRPGFGPPGGGRFGAGPSGFGGGRAAAGAGAGNGFRRPGSDGPQGGAAASGTGGGGNGFRGPAGGGAGGVGSFGGGPGMGAFGFGNGPGMGMAGPCGRQPGGQGVGDGGRGGASAGGFGGGAMGGNKFTQRQSFERRDMQHDGRNDQLEHRINELTRQLAELRGARSSRNREWEDGFEAGMRMAMRFGVGRPMQGGHRNEGEFDRRPGPDFDGPRERSERRREEDRQPRRRSAPRERRPQDTERRRSEGGDPWRDFVGNVGDFERHPEAPGFGGQGFGGRGEFARFGTPFPRQQWQGFGNFNAFPAGGNPFGFASFRFRDRADDAQQDDFRPMNPRNADAPRPPHDDMVPRQRRPDDRGPEGHNNRRELLKDW